MYRRFRRRVYLQGSKKSQVILGVILTCLLILIAGGLWLFYVHKQDAPTQEIQQDTTNQQASLTERAVNDSVQEQDEPEVLFNADALQQTLDTWKAGLSSSATAGVVIADGGDGEVLAQINQDESFFTASIYKLYVAYEGYRLVDAGLPELEDSYLEGNTFGQCLDLMVRESNSPCAEKLMMELGKDETTKQLQSYGMTHTSLVSLTTTATDAATMMARIARGEGLSSASQAALLQSMKDQIYRDTLNRGFSEAVTIYNKIGFNEQLEYHDVALLELADGRQLVVSVLTQRVGTSRIVNLAKQLEVALTAQM